MRVALVHYWWVANRGGEAVCAEILRLFPDADVFVHTRDEDAMQRALPSEFCGRVLTTFIDRLPRAQRFYKAYLLLMPLALEQLDLSAYDLVISSESGPAKGVVTRPDAVHICYCHTPMRYLWDLYGEYSSGLGRFSRLLFALSAHWLRVWDRASADRVDHFVANSAFVAQRIRKFYRRDAEVIHPPVDTERFRRADKVGEHFTFFGQLVSYKRADLAIAACARLGLPLRVIGEGDGRARLERDAGPHVQFLGRLSDEELTAELGTSRGLIFPGLEDFGIVPLEAMASGVPVIAFGRGGALDTVIDGETGVLFREQSVDGLAAGIERFLTLEQSFDRDHIVRHARRFDAVIFRSSFADFVDGVVDRGEPLAQRTTME